MYGMPGCAVFACMPSLPTCGAYRYIVHVLILNYDDTTLGNPGDVS